MSAPGWATDTRPPESGAALDEYGALHCQCGNTPDFDGFLPCDRLGFWDDDLLSVNAAPGSLFYLCGKCGLVFGPWPSVRVANYVPEMVYQEPRLDTVTCSECGRVGSEAATCWYMATPVCPECFDRPPLADGMTA